MIRSPKLRAALALLALAGALAACGKKPPHLDYPEGTPEGTHARTYPAPANADNKTSSGWGFP